MEPVYRSVKQNASRNLSIKTLVNPSFSTVEGTLFIMQESQDNAADSVDLMRDIRSTGLPLFAFSRDKDSRAFFVLLFVFYAERSSCRRVWRGRPDRYRERGNHGICEELRAILVSKAGSALMWKRKKKSLKTV